MFLDWLRDLGALDKLIVLFSAILFIGFTVFFGICRFKYDWEREECDEYLKECHDDKKFEDLNNKNNQMK